MIGPSNLPELIASRYRPIRLIAAGGMGAVYEVEHTLTGERLALKVLSWSANASPEALARFKREVRASAIIKSDNVVRVTDADVAPELGGAPFLVMELLEGTDLEQAAATAPPTPATVVEWLRQVARAIDKAHQLGIVHRDLKPENLFLATKSDGAPVVKILDFGIVKLMEEETGATGTGQILGTPKYMAFEQASANAQVTPATDRCALGLIAYRLLMGESYYQGGVMSILGQLLHGQLQPPSERGSRLPRAFDAWFLKACHRDPEERFASASEQIEALAAALGLATLPIEAMPEASSRIGSRRGGKRARPILLASVSAAALLVVAVAATRHARTGGSDAAVCGLPSRGVTAACGPCIAQACCGEAQACSDTEGCPQVEACVRACASGDGVCRARCNAGKSRVARLQQAVETCRATSCADQCLPAPWACLGHVKWDLPATAPQTIEVKTVAVCTSCGNGGSIVGGGGGSPIAGATVRVCSLADPTCAIPLTAGKTDDKGALTLSIDASSYRPPLSVFFEYHKEGGRYQDTLEHFNTPLTVDTDLGHTVVYDEKANQEPRAAEFGAVYDPTRAMVDVLPIDCNGRPATKEVELTWLDRDAKTVVRPYFGYSRGAIAVNLPVNAAGVTRIVARVAATHQLIATATVAVRPRAETCVFLAPSP
jgi:hypothetical protein